MLGIILSWFLSFLIRNLGIVYLISIGDYLIAHLLFDWILVYRALNNASTPLGSIVFLSIGSAHALLIVEPIQGLEAEKDVALLVEVYAGDLLFSRNQNLFERFVSLGNSFLEVYELTTPLLLIIWLSGVHLNAVMPIC